MIAMNYRGTGIKSESGPISWKFQTAPYVYPNSGVDYIRTATAGQDSSELNMAKRNFIHEDLHQDVYECPEFPLYEDHITDSTYDDWNTGKQDLYYTLGGYGHSGVGQPSTWFRASDGETVKSTFEGRFSIVRSPSETVLLGDSMETSNKVNDPLASLRKPKDDDINKLKFRNAHHKGSGDSIIYGVNVGFVDGRVAWMSDDDLREHPSANDSSKEDDEYYWRIDKRKNNDDFRK